MSILGCSYFACNVTDFTFINQICWSLHCEYTQPYSNTLHEYISPLTPHTSLPSPPHMTQRTQCSNLWRYPSVFHGPLSPLPHRATSAHHQETVQQCHPLQDTLHHGMTSKWCRVLWDDGGMGKYFVVMSLWCRSLWDGSCGDVILWYCTVVRERSICLVHQTVLLWEERVWYESGH